MFLDYVDQTGSFLDKGVDKGGLTRAFLDTVWSQMHTLSIDVRGETVVTEKTLPLFDSKDGSIVPLDDVTIRGHVAKCFAIDEAALDKNEGAGKILKQVKRYYRALGRLMIHSLATGHVLPSHVMPPFFRACKCPFSRRK
jgi:hypothetical protein